MLKHIHLISVPALVLEMTTPMLETQASFTCQMKPILSWKKILLLENSDKKI